MGRSVEGEGTSWCFWRPPILSSIPHQAGSIPALLQSCSDAFSNLAVHRMGKKALRTPIWHTHAPLRRPRPAPPPPPSRTQTTNIVVSRVEQDNHGRVQREGNLAGRSHTKQVKRVRRQQKRDTKQVKRVRGQKKRDTKQGFSGGAPPPHDRALLQSTAQGPGGRPCVTPLPQHPGPASAGRPAARP